MKKSKKIVWTIIVVVIGSIASQIIAEQVGAGQYVAPAVSAVAVAILFSIWGKKSNKEEDNA